MKAAFHVARTGRCGPVLVDIPRDVQEAELDFEYPDEVDLPGWKPPTARPSAPDQARRRRRSRAAERPVLYVGGGTLNADACAELRELAEVGRLPVVTTLMGKSAFPETHELHFGWPGMHGPKWSNWAMNKCDLLVAVGARFDDRVTGKLSAFAPGATVIHLDIDSAEIGKLRQRGHPRRRPAEAGPRRPRGRAARSSTRTGRTPRTEPWLRQLAAWREEFPLRYGEGGDMLKPQTRARDAAGAHRRARRRRLDDRRRPAPDVGDAVPPLRPAAHRSSPRAGSGRWATACPAAIGAKAARPDATVVCVDGDGCFQMTGQELATAVLEDLPIVVVIVNNGYLGMVQQWQDMFFDERLSQVHLTHARARLRAARRGVRRRRLHGRRRGRARGRARGGARLRPHRGRRRARRPARAVLPDDPGRRGRARPGRVRGAARRRWRRREAHAVRPRREQAGRAHAHLEHVRAARLQHREPRGRADRAARRLADHAARRLRAAPARADREADAQARERPARLGARAGRGRRARARADQGRRAARPARRADRARRRRSTPASPTSAPTRSSSRSSATPRRSTRSRSSSARTASRSSSAPGRIGLGRALRTPQTAPPPARPHAEPTRRRRPDGNDPPRRQPRPPLRQGRRRRLRQPGPRPRPQPARLGRRGRGRPARGQRRRGPPPRRRGSTVGTVAEAVAGAQLVSLLLPDQVQPQVYEEDVAPNLEPGRRAPLRARLQRPLRAHRAARRARRDHGRARRAPGHIVRRLFTEGFGTPALVAVAQDASGRRVRPRARLRRRRSAPRAPG